MDWETFATLYRQEVSAAEQEKGLLEEVRRLEGEHGTVTLLCHENLRKPDNDCHREILKEMLDSGAGDNSQGIEFDRAGRSTRPYRKTFP